MFQTSSAAVVALKWMEDSKDVSVNKLYSIFLNVDAEIDSVVISRPRSRDSSALEFIFRRSRSWSRVITVKVSNLVSSF